MRTPFLLIPLTALALIGTGAAQTPVPAPPSGPMAGGAGAPPRTTPQNTVLNGTWELIGGTAVRPVTGDRPNLTFTGARVSGTAGCNRLTGTVQMGAGTVTFGPLATTRMLCAPAVNTQETAFLRFLGQRALRAQVRGATLTLTDATGQTLNFRRTSAAQGSGPSASPLAPVEGTFTLTSVNGQPAPQTAVPVSLTLNAGQLSGSDGCNTFSATYRLDGNRLVLTGEPVSTLRACPEAPDHVNVPAVLAARPTITATAAGLTLQADGTSLIFKRK